MFDFIKRCFKYRTLRELIDSYKQPSDSVKVERVGDNHIKATVDLGCISKSAFTSENFERYRKESEREIRERSWSPLSNNLVGLTAEELKRTIFEKWTDNGTSESQFFMQKYDI